MSTDADEERARDSINRKRTLLFELNRYYLYGPDYKMKMLKDRPDSHHYFKVQDQKMKEHLKSSPPQYTLPSDELRSLIKIMSISLLKKQGIAGNWESMFYSHVLLPEVVQKLGISADFTEFPTTDKWKPFFTGAYELLKCLTKPEQHQMLYEGLSGVIGAEGDPDVDSFVEAMSFCVRIVIDHQTDKVNEELEEFKHSAVMASIDLERDGPSLILKFFGDLLQEKAFSPSLFKTLSFIKCNNHLEGVQQLEPEQVFTFAFFTLVSRQEKIKTPETLYNDNEFITEMLFEVEQFNLAAQLKAIIQYAGLRATGRISQTPAESSETMQNVVPEALGKVLDSIQRFTKRHFTAYGQVYITLIEESRRSHEVHDSDSESDGSEGNGPENNGSEGNGLEVEGLEPEPQEPLPEN
jgi:hypothetical protein